MGLTPEAMWPSTPSKGKIPKADTPNPSNKKINLPLTNFETKGAGGIKLSSYDDGTNGLGICEMIKNQNGTGFVLDHGGAFEQRNECTSYVGTKGESVQYGNGNHCCSHDGNSTTRAAERTCHSATDGGGDSSTSSGGLNRSVCKISADSSQMHTIGGSLGFVCGGTFGAAGKEVNIKAGGNMSCGAAGTTSFSGQLDCSVGSQTGCMHMYGKGIALGALQGDIAFDAGKTMNFTTGGQYVSKAGGNMYFRGAKIYLNSSSPIPLSTDEIASTYGKSVTPDGPDAIRVVTAK